jgi:hypothetical protein
MALASGSGWMTGKQEVILQRRFEPTLNGAVPKSGSGTAEGFYRSNPMLSLTAWRNFCLQPRETGF